MSKAIHHRCRCTGETFTDTQWYHWLKNHDSRESVFEFKEFRYNINDVCLTPRKPVEWQNKYCRIVITTAQSPNGLWDYGYDFRFHDNAGNGGAIFVDDDYNGYQSEKAAISSCLKWMRKILGNILKYMRAVGDDFDEFGNYTANSTILPYLERANVQIDALIERFDPRQLDLFE